MVSKAFIKFTGSYDAGVLLGQLLYWYPRAANEGIYKSDAEFCDELCMSRYGLRAAKELLANMGIVKLSVGMWREHQTTYYELDLEKLGELWQLFIDKNKPVVSKPIIPFRPAVVHASPVIMVPLNDPDDNPPEEGQQMVFRQDDPVCGDTSPCPPADNATPEIPSSVPLTLTVPDTVNLTETTTDDPQGVNPAILRRESARKAMNRGIARNAQEHEVKIIDASKFPEDVRVLAQRFCTLFGRMATGDEFGFWLKEFRKQIAIGLTPDDIERAIKKMREDELPIGSPKSVTNMAYSLKSKPKRKGDLGIESANEVW